MKTLAEPNAQELRLNIKENVWFFKPLSLVIVRESMTRFAGLMVKTMKTLAELNAQELRLDMKENVWFL